MKYIELNFSEENIAAEAAPQSVKFKPYFQPSPIRNEDIFQKFSEAVFSSFDDPKLPRQDSIDEEFHENLIYGGGKYLRRSGSSTSDDLLEIELRKKSSETLSSTDECVVPSVCVLTDRRQSPFTSNDSLETDIR